MFTNSLDISMCVTVTVTVTRGLKHQKKKVVVQVQVAKKGFSLVDYPTKQHQTTPNTRIIQFLLHINTVPYTNTMKTGDYRIMWKSCVDIGCSL
jgi:hypothetical protein